VPEGDTVWLAAQRMHEALAGDVLVKSDFRVPSLATVDLSGGPSSRSSPAASTC
jgi:endonuclease-8